MENIIVNGQEMQLEQQDIDTSIFDGCGALMVEVVAPKGEKASICWWFNETEEGSGIYEFNDEAYDASNGSHVEFVEWIQKQTGCEYEDALEAMEEIYNQLDTSTRYLESATGDDVGELFTLLLKDDTTTALAAGTLVSNISARIFRTNENRYIGVIADREQDVDKRIVELTKEEFEKAKEAANEFQYGDAERFTAIYNAIVRNDEEDY